MVTILIVLRYYHGNLFYECVIEREVKKLAYLAGYWFDLAQIWYTGVSLVNWVYWEILNPKPIIKLSKI